MNNNVGRRMPYRKFCSKKGEQDESGFGYLGILIIILLMIGIFFVIYFGIIRRFYAT
jgi:hypothetical protein